VQDTGTAQEIGLVDFSRMLAATNRHKSHDPCRAAHVLHARLTRRTTLRVVAQELGVGPERIRQIEAKALRYLRTRWQRLDPQDLTMLANHTPTRTALWPNNTADEVKLRAIAYYIDRANYAYYTHNGY
jgi:hypothetical protein